MVSLHAVYSSFGASDAAVRPLMISSPREKIMYVEPTSQAPLYGCQSAARFATRVHSTTHLGMIHNTMSSKGGLWPMLSKPQ